MVRPRSIQFAFVVSGGPNDSLIVGAGDLLDQIDDGPPQLLDWRVPDVDFYYHAQSGRSGYMGYRIDPRPDSRSARSELTHVHKPTGCLAPFLEKGIETSTRMYPFGGDTDGEAR
jgi:hypothetical protein